MIRVVEQHYTIADISLLVGLCKKVLYRKLVAGDFGRDVVNLGSDIRPDYRVPASAINAWLDRKRLFHERARDPGQRVQTSEPARTAAELHQPVPDVTLDATYKFH